METLFNFFLFLAETLFWLVTHWYIVFIVIAVIIIIKIATHSMKKDNITTYNYNDLDAGISKEVIAKQTEICEKYGFVRCPGERMRPELLEKVLRDEREYRDSMKQKRLENLRKDLGLDSMDGHEFEELCAEILSCNGFECKVTNGSGDHGADIIATENGTTYAIQVKSYSQPVGNKAVQEAHAGRTYFKTQKAVVLTNNTFTPQAKEDAKRLDVILWDVEYLANLLKGV